MPVLKEVTIADAKKTFAGYVKEGYSANSLETKLPLGDHKVTIVDKVTFVNFGEGGKSMMALQNATDANGQPANFPIDEKLLGSFKAKEKKTVTVFEKGGRKFIKLAAVVA